MKNNNKNWTGKEEKILVQHIMSGTPVKKVSSKLQRSESSCLSRAKMLLRLLNKSGFTKYLTVKCKPINPRNWIANNK